ncbi:PREDICTED: solute carrier family 2, facilitated glucose transporter member 11-like isoform X1 [Gavialis gangeticus]|uniref:solute carrier family 2, facilitated glucose transporter member 11-like isoform X1 n=1 Tax=Gavialis gangeticus TaxID=94835 RepID=UPI00092F6236|nr:PREDICTED: solute carrier family 2, facilitated glucose transporter member 11-like isoform X1 [Gavialis gangeticus]
MADFLSDLVQYQKFFQMIFVLGIGGTFQIGFQVAMITYTSMHVKSFINETWLERYDSPIQSENLLLLWSFIVSIFGIGGILASMSSGYLSVKYGKKKCLMGNNLLMLVSALFLGFSRMARSFEMILIGRLLCGMSAGFALLLHPQYIGEISPKKLRGFGNSTAAVFWALGKSIGQVMGQRELLGSKSLWPMLMALGGIPALAQLVTLPFFPESPPYFLIHKGDEDGCMKAMNQLWGEGHHQVEIDEMLKEKSAMKNTKVMSILELLKEASFRWQLYTLISLSFTIQLSGINAIYFYALDVLHTAGFDQDTISYMSLGIGFCELISAIFCTVIIERCGRKVLLWCGYWIMAFLAAILTVTISLQDWFFWVPYCSLGLIIIYVSCFAIGPAGATASVRVEIFDQSSRPPAFVIGGSLNWTGLFVIGMTFPFIVESLGQFCFLIFMGVLFISGISIYLFLPETKGKSAMEIREEFNKLNFRKKCVPDIEKNFTEDYTFCTKL